MKKLILCALPLLLLTACNGGGNPSTPASDSKLPSVTPSTPASEVSVESESESESESSESPKPQEGFAVVVNGTDYYSLTDEGEWDMDPSFHQYSYKGLDLESTDVITFYNVDEDASWTDMTVDPASVGGWTLTPGTGISGGEDGCYDLYIKMKFQADNIYFGPHQ